MPIEIIINLDKGVNVKGVVYISSLENKMCSILNFTENISLSNE